MPLGVAVNDRASGTDPRNRPGLDLIVKAIEASTSAACEAIGRGDLDVGPVGIRARRTLAWPTNFGAGYWQVHARPRPSGALITLYVGDGGYPGGNAPMAADIPLAASATEPESRTGQFAGGPGSGVQIEIIDDGHSVLIIVDCGGTTALAEFCCWLNGLRTGGAGKRAANGPGTLNPQQQAAVRQAELVVAYDSVAGHGAWFRRVRQQENERPATTAAPTRVARPAPKTNRSGSERPRKAGGSRSRRLRRSRVSQGRRTKTGRSSRPAPSSSTHSKPGMTGSPSINGGTDKSRIATAGPTTPNHSASFPDLLRASGNPAEQVRTLQSALHSAASTSRATKLRLGPTSVPLARYGAVPKVPGDAWLIATARSGYEGWPERPLMEATLFTVPIAAGPSAPGTLNGQPVGQVIYLIDGAVLDTLINIALGLIGPGDAGYAKDIQMVQIIVQPRLIIVRAITMTASAILKAHGLGILAPGVARILTRVLVWMLNALLGQNDRFARLQWLLGWLEVILYGRAGHLPDSPTFRGKLADWLNWLWHGRPRTRSRSRSRTDDADSQAADDDVPPPNDGPRPDDMNPPGGPSSGPNPPPGGSSPGPSPPNPPPPAGGAPDLGPGGGPSGGRTPSPPSPGPRPGRAPRRLRVPARAAAPRPTSRERARAPGVAQEVAEATSGRRANPLKPRRVSIRRFPARLDQVLSAVFIGLIGRQLTSWRQVTTRKRTVTSPKRAQGLAWPRSAGAPRSEHSGPSDRDLHTLRTDRPVTGRGSTAQRQAPRAEYRPVPGRSGTPVNTGRSPRPMVNRYHPVETSSRGPGRIPAGPRPKFLPSPQRGDRTEAPSPAGLSKRDMEPPPAQVASTTRARPPGSDQGSRLTRPPGHLPKAGLLRSTGAPTSPADPPGSSKDPPGQLRPPAPSNPRARDNPPSRGGLPGR